MNSFDNVIGYEEEKFELERICDIMNRDDCKCSHRKENPLKKGYFRNQGSL